MFAFELTPNQPSSGMETNTYGTSCINWRGHTWRDSWSLEISQEQTFLWAYKFTFLCFAANNEIMEMWKQKVFFEKWKAFIQIFFIKHYLMWVKWRHVKLDLNLSKDKYFKTLGNTFLRIWTEERKMFKAFNSHQIWNRDFCALYETECF